MCAIKLDTVSNLFDGFNKFITYSVSVCVETNLHHWCNVANRFYADDTVL